MMLTLKLAAHTYYSRYLIVVSMGSKGGPVCLGLVCVHAE
jgi:hypothetical protein